MHEAAEERYEQEFLTAHDRLTAAGLEHYEVSNYARPGARARHNSAYWTRAPYLGLGPSAHSFDGSRRRWNEREYVAWCARATSGEDPIAGSETLTPDDVLTEEAYLGLRTDRGVRIVPDDRPDVRLWVKQGWAELCGDVLRLTPQGLAPTGCPDERLDRRPKSFVDLHLWHFRS